jgi:hypothetical protein
MDVEMGKRHIGCVVGELDSPVVGWTMKLPDYITIEPAAIIARMFKRKAGAWLKIFETNLLFKVEVALP